VLLDEALSGLEEKGELVQHFECGKKSRNLRWGSGRKKDRSALSGGVAAPWQARGERGRGMWERW